MFTGLNVCCDYSGMHISYYDRSLKGGPPQVLAYVTTYVQCRLRKLVLHQTEGGGKDHCSM